MTIKWQMLLSRTTWWLPFTIGFFITVSAAWLLHKQNEYELTAYSQTIASEITDNINKRFRYYEYGLSGTRAAILAVGVNNLSREQFENYINSRDIELEFPGLLGLGFIERVPKSQERQFLIQARADGAPNFTIKTLNAHSKDRFIIKYIYPEYNNVQAVGLDIGSERNRREAALAAARNNQPHLTLPITLVQANNKPQKGVLIMLPIYNKLETMLTPNSQEASTIGWVYSPLVIDQVLAPISQTVPEVLFTLTDTRSNTAFYESNDQDVTPYSKHTITSTISIMGQHWALSVTPNAKALKAIDNWNIQQVLIIGLSATLLFSLILSLVHPQIIAEQNSPERLTGLASITAYIKSSVFCKTWPPTLILIVLLFMTSCWFITERQLSDVKQQLVQVNKQALNLFSQEAKKYHRGVLFLANTVSSVMLNLPQPDAQLSINARARLADVFKAYMLATPNVHQVRFIAASEIWRESVKVQRFTDTLRTFDGVTLQSKKGEPYITQSVKLGANNVYVSAINLNREVGQIEYPARPVWRFATVIENEDGDPLGIVVINVSAAPLLNMASKNTPSGIETYILNAYNQFLSHPTSTRTFAFELNESFKWEDEFSRTAWSSATDILGLRTLSGQFGNVWAKKSHFLHDKSLETQALNIHSTVPQFPIIKDLLLQFVLVLSGLTGVALISAIIQFWGWRNAQSKHREQWLSKQQSQRGKEVARFKALLDSAPDATLVTDSNGTIQMANAQAIKLFGYHREDLEGSSINVLIPKKYRDAHNHHLAQFSEQPQTRSMAQNRELWAIDAMGNELPVEVSLGGVRLDEQLLITASIRSISERLAIEEQLRNALLTAEKATEAKSVFLANTSHEIRTPLNAIIGLTHLLIEEPLSDEHLKLVEKIQMSGKSLLGIVNDVLDLSKIEANEMKIESSPVALTELLEEISSIFLVQSQTKGLNFNLNIHPDLPRWVVTDSTRLRQILVNLLGNAIKFTELGDISLTVEPLSSSSAHNSELIDVQFKVCDTGIGISEQAQSKLFKPFTQADDSTTRRFGGTGLGLSIVSKLVSLLDGKISVTSKSGQGSQFMVCLPLHVANEHQINALPNQNESLFIIIAEDNPDDAKRIQNITKALGWRSEIVKDGEALIENYTYRKTKKLRLPEVMLVDWKMPKLDGISALKQLAAIVGREQLPTVLMISATSPQDIRPLDDFDLIYNVLQKPINASGLFNAVNDAVTQSTGNAHQVIQSTRTDAIKAKWLSGMHILVVDDSQVNLEVASSILIKNGAHVYTANSGENALSLLKSTPELYDTVLMDVQMPGIDGLETTKLIRQSLGLTALPIIALTAGALVEEKERALASGMNDFLSKPFEPSSLIKTLRSSVGEYRSQLPQIQPLDSKPDANIDNWPKIEGLNQSQAKQLLLGDEQLFLKTLDRLLTEHTNLITLPIDNIMEDDQQQYRLEIAAQVHKLRSVAGTVGAQQLHTLASEAENSLQKDLTSAKATLIQLIASLKQLEQASNETLSKWRASQLDNIVNASANSSASLTHETTQQILLLLQEQDLAALDEIEQHSALLYDALGKAQFALLQKYLEELNYQELITIISTLAGEIEEPT
ncbi:Sensor histidine kinase RcsC [Pseudoalteromonas sp. CIP111854]|uniref:histidine kinase n=1 Tax=Pseudoalteromonas holothuriae TaxID=2963714 RepID=A0A9W4QYR6_9GAMM|nr:CHASE domain-containing protein [Pseudoalteromonas sp. CIP111854]CAH9058758.1 Sensor histidine kinase RcsC [Pseudoalteromonas sp. CIP111854]